MTKRNHNLDLLRCTAALLVVLIHVEPSHLAIVDVEATAAQKCFSIFTIPFCKMASPLFVMLSGYFCLALPKTNHLKSFYLDCFNKLVPVMIVSTIIAAILSIYVQDLGIKTFITDLIAGAPYYHLWYLSMFLGLYALVPFLVLIKEEYGEKCFLRIGLVLLVLTIPASIFSNVYWTFQCVFYLGFFILGYALPRCESLRFFHLYLWTCIASCITISLSYFYYPDFSEKLKLLNHNSPLMALATISLFMYFCTRSQVQYDWGKWTKYNLNFYVFHAFFITFFTSVLKLCGTSKEALGAAYTPIAFFTVSITTLLFLYFGGNNLLKKIYLLLSIKR